MNPLSPALLSTLRSLALYYALSRIQLGALVLPGLDPKGRRMREYLVNLRELGYVARTDAQVVFPHRNGAPCPAYHLTTKGREKLAEEMKDESFLKCCVRPPHWHHLQHTLKVADARIVYHQAIAPQTEVGIEHSMCEHMTRDFDGKTATLFTLLQEHPRLVCAPDASFVLTYHGHRKGVYLEIDRATSGINQIAHSKTPGYFKLAQTNGHLRHHPGVLLPPVPREGSKPIAPFIVLHISPSTWRRDQIAKAVKGKPGDWFWRFVSWEDFSPETALFEPICIDVDGKAHPLVRRIQEDLP